MEVVYLLLPFALLLAAGALVVFFWAVRSGQFDDLEGPAHRILRDDDGSPQAEAEGSQEARPRNT